MTNHWILNESNVLTYPDLPVHGDRIYHKHLDPIGVPNRRFSAVPTWLTIEFRCVNSFGDNNPKQRICTNKSLNIIL